jgi:uncharacterized membrane protein
MQWIKEISLVIEVLAVVIIVGMVAYSTGRYFASLITKRKAQGADYLEYKHTLGRALLLGLEILVAADVIRTVALEPTWNNIAALGLLVVVRTLLSWTLVVEIEGHWPWRAGHSNAEVGEYTK